MKPLGKTMKIAHRNKVPERTALQQLLDSYRDTPHPATRVSPAAMLFRDGQKGTFPRRSASPEEIVRARMFDLDEKGKRRDRVNSSKYRKATEFSVGDEVLVRNYKKSSKFQPIFIPEPYVVTQINDNGRYYLTLERVSDGQILKRHPDDVKFDTAHSRADSDIAIEMGERYNWPAYTPHPYSDNDYDDVKHELANDMVPADIEVEGTAAPPNDNQLPRRSQRERHANPRYNDFET